MTPSPPLPPATVAQATPPIWEEEPDRRNLYIAIAAVAIAVIVLLVVMLGKGGSSPTPTTPQALVPTTPATPEPTTPSTPQPTPVSASSVEQLLSEYESDYSSESAEGLRGLFSEQLTRKDGSKPTEDLNEAIHTYEQQFSELTQPRYTLSNIRVVPGTGEATAGAEYSITSQNGTVRGSIGFDLGEQEGRLLINSITVTPSK